MAIARRVAVSGEVLAGRGGAPRAQPRQRREAEARDFSGVLAVGAGADHRIAGIVVDIEDRREVEVEAERAQLAGGRAAPALGVRRVAGRAHRHRGGEGGGRVFEAADPPPLLIDRDERGEAGEGAERLDARGQRPRLVRHADAAPSLRALRAASSLARRAAYATLLLVTGAGAADAPPGMPRRGNARRYKYQDDWNPLALSDQIVARRGAGADVPAHPRGHLREHRPARSLHGGMPPEVPACGAP